MEYEPNQIFPSHAPSWGSHKQSHIMSHGLKMQYFEGVMSPPFEHGVSMDLFLPTCVAAQDLFYGIQAEPDLPLACSHLGQPQAEPHYESQFENAALRRRDLLAI